MLLYVEVVGKRRDLLALVGRSRMDESEELLDEKNEGKIRKLILPEKTWEEVKYNGDALRKYIISKLRGKHFSSLKWMINIKTN